MSSFSHLNEQGQANMVDVGDKTPTQRIAQAQAIMYLGTDIIQQLEGGDIQTKKGSVFQTARLAGIMAAKKTSDLIPLCHPLALQKVDIDIQVLDEERIRITCLAKVYGRTGVEMEALTGANIAALTVYDMCKAMSLDLRIEAVQLLEKTGGKRNFKRT